jgi:hypothetical protein
MFRITPLLTVRGSYTCIRQSRKYLYEWKWNTDNLDKGILAIQNYKDAIPQGDILYNGNLQSWVRFAKSLKIKYLVRISTKVNVSAKLQALYTEGNYITTNAQNAVLALLILLLIASG